MELSQFTTRELSEELSRREGVDIFIGEGHEPVVIMIGGNSIKYDGPATILVNID